MTRTRKMLEAACSYSLYCCEIGQGLFSTVNFSLGSPVASFMIDSYMNCGYAAALSTCVMLTRVPTLNYFVELFIS